MKTILTTCILLLTGSMKLAAQSTTIDYAAWNNSNCNAFSDSPTINGVLHKTVLGQPYKNAQHGIVMITQRVGTTLKGTAFSFDYTLQAQHYYKIKVWAMGPPTNYPLLYVYPTSGITSINTTCTGMDPIAAWGNNVYPVGGPMYLPHEFVYTVNMSGSSADKVVIAAVPNSYANPPGATQPISVQKIIIIDITTTIPSFSLTANTSARNCGSDMAVTYTIHNNNNMPNVDHYEFRCEPGKWMYNGAPATNITTSSNAISLSPVACAGPGKVKGVAHFVNPASEAETNELTLSKLVPTYIITGPANLNNVAGNYNLTTNPISYPPPSTIFICGALPTWNVTPGNLVQLTIASDTQVGLNPNKGGPVSANGTVLLTATMVMCEQTVTATKSVKIGPPDLISPDARMATQNEGDPKEEVRFKIQGIYPNPTQGIFTIELDAFHEAEKISVDVLSISGQIVLTKAVSSKTSELDLSGFAKGNYVVRISNGKNTIIEKVILE